MRVNLKHKAAEIEETPQNQEKTDLSRRTFLARLTILGVGCAAAMTLGVREADATIETHAAGNAKDLADGAALAEGKKAEFVEVVDPDDPLQQFAQVLTPGERRRVGRRTRRTGRRVRRRVRRRVIVR